MNALFICVIVLDYICCTYSNICWSNTKIFLSVLIVFGKFFCFENFQNFQKLCISILATLPRKSSQSWDPSHELTQKLLRLFGESSSLLRKRLWKIFKKSGFLAFSWLSLATGSRVEALVVSLLKMLRNLLASRPSSHEKYLDKFLKFVTWVFGDLFATHSNREKHVFCTMKVIFRAVFKNFSFFPRILWLFIILSVPLFSKITILTHKAFIFFIYSSPIFKKRVWVLSLSQCILCFYPLISWILCFLLRFENMMLKMICGYFVEFDVWVLLVLVVCCL